MELVVEDKIEVQAKQLDVTIRPLQKADLPAADLVMRVAFGTLIGVPEPASFFGDASWVSNRWQTDPSAGFVAEMNGEIVGSNFATHWGSFGFFGPLTIRPDVWNRGIGSKLMEPIMNRFSEWRVVLAGLFTSPNSLKHVSLYQKFGFSPRYLTAIMGKSVNSAVPTLHWGCYSNLSEDEQSTCLKASQSLTDSIFEGLDLTSEIQAIEAQSLGDTVLIWDESELVGFAACHYGPGTEAGSGSCYVKFAAVQPDKQASRYFDELLTACEGFAAEKGALRLVAGVNTSRQAAYKQMFQHGFRTDVLGVAMHMPNESGFSRRGVYVLDDWR